MIKTPSSVAFVYRSFTRCALKLKKELSIVTPWFNGIPFESQKCSNYIVNVCGGPKI